MLSDRPLLGEQMLSVGVITVKKTSSASLECLTLGFQGIQAVPKEREIQS